MFPFGSGAPNNAPFGAGYPQQPQPGYPQQPQPTYPQPGYPQQQSQPGYPQSGYGYPNANNQPMPFGGGFAQTQQPAYPQSNYPTQAGYPVASQYAGYPPQTAGYPPQTAGYPPQTAGYPVAQPPYSAPSQYPSPNITSGLPQNNYPTQQYQYPTNATPAHNYPSSAAVQMAACFQAANGTKKKGTPTVLPAENFDAVADANALRKAMKGFGTDEDGLIEVICRRSNAQRQEIAKMFKTHFGKDLIENVKSECSGNFENLLVALLTPTITFYVTELHDAFAGIGTDEDVLIEILCTMSNYEIGVIKDAYQSAYGKSLEDDIISDTSGNFKRLLVSLCTAARDESGATDPEQARTDATELLRAGELRVGTDESTFNMILCQQNYQQLRLIFEEYEKMCGHGFEKAVEKEFSGDVKDGLLAIVQCVKNKAEFFARRLHKSMAGIGTTDKQLIRLVVTRCEIDMQEIKAAFEHVFGKSLKSWIKGDTSGHYKHALYALIGENRS